MELIRSRQNSHLKAIRKLRRSRGEAALLEGEHLVREAVRAGLRLEWLLLTPRQAETGWGEELRGSSRIGSVQLVLPELLATVCDADSPHGPVALCELPRSGVGSLPVRAGGCYLLLDRIQDPGNLGALARVAEATACAGLALTPGCVHPNHPRALRASAGSLLRLPAAVDAEPEALLAHLRTIGPALVGLSAHGGEPLAGSGALDGPLVLALGSEGAGLAAGIVARLDRSVTIPLAPPVESLNVAVAAAVALFERRRAARGD